MSILVPIDSLNYEQKYKVDNELEIKIESPNFGLKSTRSIYPYDIVENDVILPFGFGCSELKLQRRPRESFSSFQLLFTGSLREEQKEIKRETIQFLNKTGSAIISAYPGFGKTCTSINIAIGIGFKTLIIVNKIVLINQWKESILKFCPDASIQIVTAKSKISDSEAHFYIVNAINVPKIKKSFFSDIGTVIVDELHLIMTESLSKSLMCVFPRYLLGLSATPYRPDSLDKLIDIYFGINKVYRKLWRKHIAYKVRTNFKPDVEYSSNGKINWSSIIDQQGNNKERNKLIVNLVLLYPERNFLILVKRVSQGEYLLNNLLEYGEHATSLLGNNQTFDRDARILIATGQKCGTGFDHDKLDTLVLASDFEEYFVQYLGRIFRKRDKEPIVYDFVDKNGILEKHFKTRKDIYTEHGGIVKQYDIENLNFEVEIEEQKQE
jgi:superfamily II DNA or RNA helicase